MTSRIWRPGPSGRQARRLVLAIAAVAAGAAMAMPSPAAAISSDYCGGIYSDGQQCYAGGGYQPWRYHKGSTGGLVTVNYLCVQSWTGSNYRTGSQCYPNASSYSFCNYYATPNANSSVNWSGGPSGNTYRLYGRADDSLNHTGITSNNGC
jgi:hypothetical protein